MSGGEGASSTRAYPHKGSAFPRPPTAPTHPVEAIVRCVAEDLLRRRASPRNFQRKKQRTYDAARYAAIEHRVFISGVSVYTKRLPS